MAACMPHAHKHAACTLAVVIAPFPLSCRRQKEIIAIIASVDISVAWQRRDFLCTPWANAYSRAPRTCVCASFLAKTWPSRVCECGREFESCVPDAVSSPHYVRAALAECDLCVFAEFSTFRLLLVRDTHGVKRLLCSARSSMPEDPTNEQKIAIVFLHNLFILHFLFSLFLSAVCSLTMALCDSLCCVKCVRINSTKRFTFAFVRLGRLFPL